jgi:hypothetical protein
VRVRVRVRVLVWVRMRARVRARVWVRVRVRVRVEAYLGEAWRAAAEVDRARAALDQRVCRLQEQHVALGHERRGAPVVPAARRREVERRHAWPHLLRVRVGAGVRARARVRIRVRVSAPARRSGNRSRGRA